MPMTPRLLRPRAKQPQTPPPNTPPSGIHPEAWDWNNRVVTNGGTVSPATLSAASAFCYAIDTAGIRNRFLRLNLFAGNSDGSLAAARTPLYRGQSPTGTQYGNATDTNVNFVQGDYAETGASGGLKGLSVSRKALRTGVALQWLDPANFHASVYVSDPVDINSAIYRNALAGPHPEDMGFGIAYGSETAIAIFGFQGAYSPPDPGFYLMASTPDDVFDLYLGGVFVGSSESLDPAPTSWAGITINSANGIGEVLCFANFLSQTNSAYYSNARLGGYSVGFAMTAAEAGNYSSAMQSFQAALNRSV